MKSSDRLCDSISAVALGLFAAVLIGLWFYQMVAAYQQLESKRQHSVETRADTSLQ